MPHFGQSLSAARPPIAQPAARPGWCLENVKRLLDRCNIQSVIGIVTVGRRRAASRGLGMSLAGSDHINSEAIPGHSRPGRGSVFDHATTENSSARLCIRPNQAPRTGFAPVRPTPPPRSSRSAPRSCCDRCDDARLRYRRDLRLRQNIRSRRHARATAPPRCSLFSFRPAIARIADRHENYLGALHRQDTEASGYRRSLQIWIPKVMPRHRKTGRLSPGVK